MTVPEQIRGDLARLASSRRTRVEVFSKKLPTHWAPYELRHPQTGETFTIESSWEFIAELLKSNHPIEIMKLKIPPDKTGYVMKTFGYGGVPIYIKLQMGSGVVIGRSFHISTPGGADEEF